jgi:dipeptidyl aminopeptidase/acylaminoacyl peptidase
MSNKVFHYVSAVTWAPNRSKAGLEYPDGSKITYDFNSGRQVTLPSHWEDFNFSPDSNQLVSKSLGTDPDNRWLIVSSSDGSQSRAVEFIGTNDDKVISSWSPNNQTVGMYTKSVDFNRQEILFIGLNDENFKSTIVEGRDVRALWSTKGDALLYSAYNNNSDLKPKLWIVGAQGDNIGSNRQDLELNTWADKCTFASETDVYCAVPDNLERGAGLFPEIANQTQDSLYKIDLKTGTKKLIAVPDGKYNISSLIVNDAQNKLYFTDNTTKQIYKINLQ